MPRPKLEVASWIAGIISAVVALYALLPPMNKAPGRTDMPQTPLSGSDVADPSYIIPPLPPVDVRSSIDVALGAAEQLSSANDRDAELERLALLAIKRQEHWAALRAARLVAKTIKKDELLDLIHCYATHLGDVFTAKHAVTQVSSTAAKSEMLKRTARVSSLKPGEGGDDAECRAL